MTQYYVPHRTQLKIADTTHDLDSWRLVEGIVAAGLLYWEDAGGSHHESVFIPLPKDNCTADGYLILRYESEWLVLAGSNRCVSPRLIRETEPRVTHCRLDRVLDSAQLVTGHHYLCVHADGRWYPDDREVCEIGTAVDGLLYQEKDRPETLIFVDWSLGTGLVFKLPHFVDELDLIRPPPEPRTRP